MRNQSKQKKRIKQIQFEAMQPESDTHSEWALHSLKDLIKINYILKIQPVQVRIWGTNLNVKHVIKFNWKACNLKVTNILNGFYIL